MGGRHLCCRHAPCCKIVFIVFYQVHRLVAYSAFYKHGMQPDTRMFFTTERNGLP